MAQVQRGRAGMSDVKMISIPMATYSTFRDKISELEAKLARYEGALKKIGDMHANFGSDSYGKPIGCQECGGTSIVREALEGEA